MAQSPAHRLGLTRPLYRYAGRYALPVRLPGGPTLRADHFWPLTHRGQPMPSPTVLIRTPYDRRLALDARLLARHGFHALVVSSRGTYGSEGEFDPPMMWEVEDGQRVMAWLRRQPFFDGRLATWGGSYLGYTQWALAIEAPPELRAMVVRVAPHKFTEAAYPGGVPSLGNMLHWANGIVHQQQRPLAKQMLGVYRSDYDRLCEAARIPPLITSYQIATERPVGYFEDWITHPPTDPYWHQTDQTEAVANTSVPVLLQGGWYDVFLNYTLQQFRLLQDSGTDVHMTIGPWTHGDVRLALGESLTEAIAWLREAFGIGQRTRTEPVQVTVTGSHRRWRMPSWPPPTTKGVLTVAGDRTLRWSEGAQLASEASTGYIFDPGDPTPTLGGAGLSGISGSVDNRPLLRRSDVVAFASRPLSSALEVAGEPGIELSVGSDRPTADFLIRLCEVDPTDGVPRNLSEGIFRLGLSGPAQFAPGQRLPQRDSADLPGTNSGRRWRLRAALGPIAHRFAAGSRILLLICSGSAPRFLPNSGTLTPYAFATRREVAHQRIWHDAIDPLRLILPIA